MIIKRIRKSDVSTNLVDKEVLGNFTTEAPLENKEKYIGILLCTCDLKLTWLRIHYVNSEEVKKKERNCNLTIHFPLLIERLKLLMYVLKTSHYASLAHEIPVT